MSLSQRRPWCRPVLCPWRMASIAACRPLSPTADRHPFRPLADARSPPGSAPRHRRRVPQGYHTLHAAGRHADFLSTHLLRVVADVQPADTAVWSSTTRRRRAGTVRRRGRIHHNPTPGPAGEKYVYGHIWVTLPAWCSIPRGRPRLAAALRLYVRRKDVTANCNSKGSRSGPSWSWRPSSCAGWDTWTLRPSVPSRWR